MLLNFPLVGNGVRGIPMSGWVLQTGAAFVKRHFDHFTTELIKSSNSNLYLPREVQTVGGCFNREKISGLYTHVRYVA